MSVKSVTTLEQRIRELRIELQANPLYQELAVLEEAHRKLLKISPVHKNENARPARFRRAGKVTILMGAKLALQKAPHPLRTPELLDGAVQQGAKVGGKDREANLVSIVSKRSDQIVSVKWNGKSAWWLIDRPLPAPDGVGTT